MAHSAIISLEQRAKGLDSGTKETTRGVKNAYSKANYTANRVKSSRPSSSHGVTFHFKHAFISKGKNESSSTHEYTTAAKHQAYIEREMAVGVNELDTQTHQNENGIIFQKNRDSFGNIGETKSEREEFWRKVERNEGRKGRVQCRIILELPHECSGNGRREIAENFCRTLHDRGLPFWCSIHVPYGENDERNHHMHILYHDRPARKINNEWDFEITEKRQYSNRKWHEHKPYKQPKDREARGREWIKHLREEFANAANYTLEKEQISKRYDPRPYEESGITKTPTIHIGTKASAAERKGISTRRGDINTEREYAWRIENADAPVRETVEWIQTIKTKYPEIRGISRVEFAIEQQKKSLEQAEIERLNIEQTNQRLNQRRRFIDKENERMKRPTTAPGVPTEYKEAGIKRLNTEYKLIEDTYVIIQQYTQERTNILREHENEAKRYEDFLKDMRKNIEQNNTTPSTPINNTPTQTNIPNNTPDEFDEIIEDMAPTQPTTPKKQPKTRNKKRPDIER